MSIVSKKVPAAVVAGVICLGLGIGAGIVLAGYFQEPKKEIAGGGGGPTEADYAAGKTGGKDGPGGGGKAGFGGPKAGGGPGGGKAGFGGPKAGGGPGGPGGGGGARSRTQLAQLVGKLDVLTAKPLSITLTPEEKQEVRKILDGLEAKEELTEEEAKEKLDALLKVVEKHSVTLEAAGFNPTGGGGVRPGGSGGGSPPTANPFKDGTAAAQLKALRATLEK
jgi:hypothetical protein